MNTNGTKGLLASTTTQGAIIAGLPAVDAILVQLGIFDQPLLSQAFAAVVSAAGAILAIWGRVKATKKISGLF